MASQSKNKTVMKEKEVEVKDVSNAKNVVLWILSAVILVFAIGGNYVLLKQYSIFNNKFYSTCCINFSFIISTCIYNSR